MDKQIQQTVKNMKKFMKELKNNPEKSKEFLINAGILNKNGELNENYK
jgi:hypothetical protein